MKKVTACWNRGRRRDFQEAAAVGYGGRDPQDSGFGLYKVVSGSCFFERLGYIYALLFNI